MSSVKYEKKVIGELVNGENGRGMNTFSTVGDLNNDGYIDLVVSGRNGEMAWFENLGGSGNWKKHHIEYLEHMECGGVVYDVDKDGFADIINGSDGGFDEIYWWKNPGNTGEKWKKYLILKTGHSQFHDVTVGNAKNDGNDYLLFTNQQGGTTVYCIKIPNNPCQSPWENVEKIAENMSVENLNNLKWNKDGTQPEEGICIGDIDGDGLNEVVSGTHWYKWTGEKWDCHRYCTDYISTKVTIGDINGDGKNEIIVSEGDAYIYGKKEGCKLAWFKPSENIFDIWEEHIIDTGLLDAHTLELADICKNGYLDIVVGEIGAFDRENSKYIIHQPKLMVYENNGDGTFCARHTIDEGTGIHEARCVDLNNRGEVDIIGKPLHGNEKWNIHAYYRK